MKVYPECPIPFNTVECKGLWYRISKESYRTGRGFSVRIQARFLKSESCSGCPECEEIRIKAKEYLLKVNNLHTKEHGQKYRLRLIKK
ncbi:MAG TPA: hypothetical protein VMW50_03520 [Dehalococcoidia bacterium]|nr:hypothetical protein [Dehalococcoidia bacterium]